MVWIGIVLYPGVQMSAALGIADLFNVAIRLTDPHLFALNGLGVCHVRAHEDGAAVEVIETAVQDEPIGDHKFSVLILPPSLDAPINAKEAAPVARWLADRHAEGSVLASVCSGAFLLGETGLLTGRTVTTHWMYADHFRSRFSDTAVDTDRLIIDGGDIISAGGLMAWTDLGLKLVARFLGPAVMAQTARVMLLDPPGREQRNYSGFVPRLTHGDSSILKAQHFLQANEGRAVRLDALVEVAGLEERTFLRRFQKATGLTATDYAQRLRIAKAQELLQFSQDSVEKISWAVGYADPGAFRKIFIRIVGLSPTVYRRKFHA